MTFKYKLAMASLAALMCAGCAGQMAFYEAPAAPQRGAWLEAAGSAPTPHGAAELCARSPELCGGAAGQTGAVSGEASGAPDLREARYDGAAIFQMLLRQQSVRLEGTAQRAPENVHSLDDGAWRQLVSVNADVNWAIRPATDEEIYGKNEVWALPLSAPGDNRTRRGDCEDYALEKRARLIALGWPQNALSIAMAEAPGLGLHAVLIAHTDKGDIVLDNLHEMPVALTEVSYSWLSEQNGASLANWVSVSFAADAANSNPPEAQPLPGAPARPEALFADLLRQARVQAEAQTVTVVGAAEGGSQQDVAISAALPGIENIEMEAVPVPDLAPLETVDFAASIPGAGTLDRESAPQIDTAEAADSEIAGDYVFAGEDLDRRLEAPSMKLKNAAIAGFCSPKSTQMWIKAKARGDRSRLSSFGLAGIQ